MMLSRVNPTRNPVTDKSRPGLNINIDISEPACALLMVNVATTAKLADRQNKHSCFGNSPTGRNQCTLMQIALTESD